MPRGKETAVTQNTASGIACMPTCCMMTLRHLYVFFICVKSSVTSLSANFMFPLTCVLELVIKGNAHIALRTRPLYLPSLTHRGNPHNIDALEQTWQLASTNRASTFGNKEFRAEAITAHFLSYRLLTIINVMPIFLDFISL
jgi:hypothetical protein